MKGFLRLGQRNEKVQPLGTDAKRMSQRTDTRRELLMRMGGAMVSESPEETVPLHNGVANRVFAARKS